MVKYYAVKAGRIPGIYNSWDLCKAQVYGYSGAIYKSFCTRKEAEKFMHDNTAAVSGTNFNLPTAEDTAVAYVDGSYDVKSGCYSYGVVMLHDSRELHFKKRFTPNFISPMRNVAGEISGSVCAIQYASVNGVKTLYIYHDYSGIAQWALGNWSANKPGTQLYRDFCHAAMQKMDIHFVKVKGHSGDQYNEIADTLAREALEGLNRMEMQTISWTG